MKHYLFLAVLSLFSFTMSSYSKEGKVKITTGVTYKGEVDDSQIPNGYGVIKYKGSYLGTSGNFNGYSVSNGAFDLSYTISYRGDFDISVPNGTTSILDYTLKNGHLVISGVEYTLDSEYKVGTQKYSSYFSHYFYESRVQVYMENQDYKAFGTFIPNAGEVVFNRVEYKDGIEISKMPDKKWKVKYNDNYYESGEWYGYKEFDRSKFSKETYHKVIPSLNCVIDATTVTGYNYRRKFGGNEYTIVSGKIVYDNGAKFNGQFADVVDEKGNNQVLYYEGTYEKDGQKDTWENGINKTALQREKEQKRQEKEMENRKIRSLIVSYKKWPVKQTLIGRTYYNTVGTNDQVGFQGRACYKYHTNYFQFKSANKVKFIDNIKMYEVNSYGGKGKCIFDTNALEYTFNCVMKDNVIYVYTDSDPNDSNPAMKLTFVQEKNILIDEYGDELKQKK